MKRITVGLAAFIAALGLGAGVATAAQAAPISTSYCWSSLNGGGSLAPDNDMIQAVQHYGTYQYYGTGWWQDENTTVVQIRFIVGGGTEVNQWMGCYRDGNGTYHDTPAYGGWTL